MSNDQSNEPDFYRRKARALLRTVRSAQPEHAALAAQRFASLRSFAGQTVGEIQARPERIRLKHALAVIAEDAGHDSWMALLATCGQDDDRISASMDAMYIPAMSALMNRWFSDYEEAAQSLAAIDGFLLPYHRQFFVTERSGIEVLGLDPDDSDWQKIGYDWLRPTDHCAWSRLWEKRRAVMAAKGGDAP